MFEKSLYDLIRGMRVHKGNEREYVQNSIRECRKEISTQDMDLKATALLKLTYLEMFGNDMSWASFNVLEVMSSPKFHQKRVGYLGAVQSFRPDTEVLVLAENLLKKDLTSPLPATIALPLVAIPHVISLSMANSLLSDLLPRLTHSHASIRKKIVVTIYRLALVYPETLRPAWPKIKERLLDEAEDPTVTAAIVNVVCELGWRRPQDFLPLAPRLFDLLVDSGNNWMAIKIIKLFATLTPLEPRLVKKLLPPLTSIIKTTPAMSLLYECINGIIQGGILNGVEGTSEGEDVARLCVGKLRGMLVLEGDPNLRYVALLAFNKIVISHAHLVALHQDVILECVDDPDISIRMRALDLAADMVTSENLQEVVSRLLRQLRNAPIASEADDPANDRALNTGVDPYAGLDDDDPEQVINTAAKKPKQAPPLPEDYRRSVIRRILDMCSREQYANMNDFEWYIGVLVELVKHVPVHGDNTFGTLHSDNAGVDGRDAGNMAGTIGIELQNVAVRVREVREEAIRAAESLVIIDQRQRLFPSRENAGLGVLQYAAWLVGEFAETLSNPTAVLDSLAHPTTPQLPSRIVTAYLQAIPKVIVRLTKDESVPWSAERATATSLLFARTIHSLEPLTFHPSLEVQERAVEFLELMRLADEACRQHTLTIGDDTLMSPPLLLTQAIPSLFSGSELNPVAVGAQKKVPLPEDLDLDTPINDYLSNLLQSTSLESDNEAYNDDFTKLYTQRSKETAAPEPAANRLDLQYSDSKLYQKSDAEEYTDPQISVRRRVERFERNRDDPFYIPESDRSGTVTPIHNILRNNNGEDVDIDSIPIMDLQLESDSIRPQPTQKAKTWRSFNILSDENPEFEPSKGKLQSSNLSNGQVRGQTKKGLLQLDSSGLESLSLEGDSSGATQLDFERREREDAEMAVAMKEVERLRLEMQRANERIQAKDEGVVVKRKKKKKAKPVGTEGEQNDAEGEVEPARHPETKKKKKKIRSEDVDERHDDDISKGLVAKTKRKKKRPVTFEGEDPS